MDRKRKSDNDLTGPKRQNHHEVAVSAHSHGYEVFLSFMGEDTRKGFTDHLYHQMVDAGISVFKDNVNLPFGGEISSSLSKAIEMSKIAVPILSKNYAASRWCLDELVCMLECRKTVLPIFYDVTPSQVKHQTESYATAFSDHSNKYDEETREKWRNALREVTSLKGLELEKETGGHEGELTKKIIGKVLVELKKTHLRVTDKFVGIDDQEREVKKLLAIEVKDVRKVVGLWGMGGIGKTTLAKFIYNQILDKFECCSFLGDIREKSLERNGLACLQSQLVSDLSKQERRNFYSVDEGVNKLEYMFHEKRVLILLDDVDDIGQLEALAGNVNWFGPGSRIIVSTRNRCVMDDLLVLANNKNIAQESWWACYEVKEMNKKKSLQLFCKHAFRQDGPEDKLSVLSHAIVETTGGLPLALEVIGSFLSRKRKSIWEETLEKLWKMPKQEVQERLKISYEMLDYDQKQMFLDAACLFIAEDIDIVMHVWKDRGFCAETGKDALLVMSLIKIVDNKIWVHDQLRDLGKEIVRNENYKEPGKRSRLRQEDEVRAAIADYSMVHGSSSEVEALCLWNASNQNNWITSEQLRNHSNIWFLDMDNVNLTGDFQHVLSKLRWLRWTGSSEDCPATYIKLEKLLYFDLSFSCIQDDWKLWSLFQSSMKLKVLNLKFCTLLTTLDASMFVNLERLVLNQCGWLKKISVAKLNFRAHEKLTSLYKLKPSKMLHCVDCERLQEIEGLAQLEALEELNLSWCEAIEKLPSLSKLKKSLKMLKCSSCSQSKDIEELDQLEALPEQNLSWCEEIEKLPSLSKLKSLKILDCHCCFELQEIEGLDQLETLQELNLSLCESIEKLPSLSKLKSLKTLNFSGCLELQEIEGLDELEALHELNLSNCKMIEKLPSLSKLKSLKIMNFRRCLKLQEIEGLNQLEALEELNLNSCVGIEKLPILSMLKSLKTLNCQYCLKLQEMGLDQLDALQKLNIFGCEGIEKLRLSKLKSLKMLDCGSCVKLQEIEGLDQLEALQELDLYGCVAIEKLPSFSKLKSLKMWNFGLCSKLQEIEGLDQF